jgi:hypothetical protein
MGSLIEQAASCCSTGEAPGSYLLEGCASGVPYTQVTRITSGDVTVFWLNMITGAVESTKPATFVAGSCVDAAAQVRGYTDEFTATAAQTAFTLTKDPEGDVQVFRNGVRLPKAAVTTLGTAATYVAAGNSGTALVADDRITFDYVAKV